MEAVPTIYRGMKSFGLLEDEEGGSLLQGGFGVKWPSTTLRARCLAHLGDRNDKAPDEKQYNEARKHLLKGVCTCGIYALMGDDIKNFGGNVYASVVAWGAVIEGASGFRAEYVRIEKLWLDFRCQYCTQAEQVDAEIKWNIYSGDGNGRYYRGSVCREHTRNFILRESVNRVKLRGFPLQEMMDEIKIRYGDAELEVGVPWRKKK